MSTKSSRRKEKRDLLVLTIFLLFLLVVGTLFFYTVEGFTLIDSFYLTSITLTTVGYGDVAPLTDTGKIFTAVYSFIGIGTFLGFAAAFLNAALERTRR